MSDANQSITVAAGQITARLMNEADETLLALEKAIGQAAAERADLLVLPECAYPAYLLGSIRSYRDGDHMTGEAFVDWLGRQAARHRMHIISGYVRFNQHLACHDVRQGFIRFLYRFFTDDYLAGCDNRYRF